MGSAWLDTTALSRILGYLAIVSGVVMSMATPTASTSSFRETCALVPAASASQDGWESPDADRVLAAAGAELGRAKAILQLDQLRGSPALQPYLDSLDGALGEPTAPLTISTVRQMALGLAFARATLEASVGSASQWLALFRVANPDHASPIPIPHRFVRRQAAAVEPPMRFDSYALAMRRAVSSLSGSSDADSSSSDRELPTSAG